MLRRHFSSLSHPSLSTSSSSSSASRTLALCGISCIANTRRSILSGPSSSGSFGGVHEQKVKGGLTGELKRGFKREVIDEREKKVRERIEMEKKLMEEASMRQQKIDYTADEDRAMRSQGERSKKGAMFMEHTDEPDYHNDKRYEAAGKVAPSVTRDSHGHLGGYEYDPEKGSVRDLSKEEATRQFEEQTAAETRKAEEREYLNKKMEERYRAQAKREPGKPLPGSKMEQRRKEKELGDFFMDNPDIAVGRPTIWISAGIMTFIFIFFAWCKDREGPLWDGVEYPEWEKERKEILQREAAEAEAAGKPRPERSPHEVAAAAVTFREIAGEERRDSYAFHSAVNAPPNKWDNLFFPEARKTKL